MEQFLSQLARQSLTAGWMILALLVLRPLLKKAPRSFSCLLWALAAVRLVTPFSLQSRVSLVPQSIAAPTRFTPILPELPVSALDQPMVQAAAPMTQVTRGIAWGQVLTVAWLVGVVAMAVYALVSYIRLIKRVQVSIRIQDKLYVCDIVRSPFVLGIFRPRIYLPSDMEPQTTAFVLAHEQAHLRRGDHIWKPLGYSILCIHWFNPLCWLAYILFCRDMEQACDEAVIRNMTSQDKKAYSAALLKCSLPRSAIAACPLAFGELSVKQRIRGVLNYRKPKFWVVAVSALLCVALAACFLTDPVKANNMETGKNDNFDAQEFPVYISPSGEEAASIQTPTAGTVIGSANLNIRSGAGTNYAEVGFLASGSEVTIYEVVTVDDLQWGRIGTDMWVCMRYVRVNEGAASMVPFTVGTGISGTFARQTKLYSLPSLKSSEVAQSEAGETYTLIRLEKIDTDTWGYVECSDSEIQGWFLMDNEEAALAEKLKATQYSDPDEQEEEIYPFTRVADVYNMPAETARALRQTAVGEECTVLRREFVNGGSWGFVQFPSDGVQGWVHFVEDDEALAYFREYVDSYAQSTPDAAESYLYFASEYAREFFRDMYAPITGWYPSGIFRVNENLWGILFTDAAQGRSVYCFVGRMNDRLYVFQNVHQVPEQLSDNLDVASYEEKNAMYLSDEYMQCSWVIKRLLAFANPVKVELQEDGTGKYEGRSMSYEDMVCGTDTWRVAREIPDAAAHCTITLYASDGSTARFWDVDGSVLVTDPDGSQACYRVDFTGKEIISMLYGWAKARA